MYKYFEHLFRAFEFHIHAKVKWEVKEEDISEARPLIKHGWLGNPQTKCAFYLGKLSNYM
jgi:hypothetical protein